MANISEPLGAGLVSPAKAPSDLSVRIRRGAEYIVIPLFALVVSAALFSLFLLALGKSPIEFFELVERGGFGTAFSLQNTLQRSAPLILTALAVAVPARIGLIMIGGEGALVHGRLRLGGGRDPARARPCAAHRRLDRDGDHGLDRRRRAGSASPATCAMPAASTRRSRRCCSPISASPS